MMQLTFACFVLNFTFQFMEKATNIQIERLIHWTMKNSDRYWKSAAEVKAGLRKLNYVKDKEAALKDNINIRFLGFGWVDCHTTWSKNGKKKTTPELTDRLIEIIRMTRQREIPDKPPACVPQRKVMPLLGQLTSAVKEIDRKRKEDNDEFELNCRKV